MVCRLRLSQCAGNTGKTPLQAVGSPNNPAVFPANGTNADGSAAANKFYNIVDATGRVIVAGGTGAQNDPFAAPVNYRNFVQYAEFPGNRVFSLVKFDVNGNPLDQYDTIVPTMLEKFAVPPHKRDGFNRLVGQEVPLIGYGALCAATVNDADAANTPAGITKFAATQSNQSVGLFNLATGQVPPNINGVASTATVPVALNAVGGPQIDISRELKQIVNGAQTPKPVQAPLEIWNKLHFWFNDDVRLSIPSVSIPFGQRFITIDLSQQDDLVFESPSIFLETIQDPLAPAPIGGPVAQRSKTYSPIFQKLGVTDLAVEKMELYINNIFVNPEIKIVGLQEYAQKRVLVRPCATELPAPGRGNTLKLREQLARTTKDVRRAGGVYADACRREALGTGARPRGRSSPQGNLVKLPIESVGVW
jgi:hypothetical protein